MQEILLRLVRLEQVIGFGGEITEISEMYMLHAERAICQSSRSLHRKTAGQPSQAASSATHAAQDEKMQHCNAL